MIKEKIASGKTYLGIELGSTRIKASLIDDTFLPVASGSFDWENRFENGFWTYSLDEIHSGVQECFKSLCENVKTTYGVTLRTVGAIGISAMMHGYLAFDKNGKLLVPFRTWRNTATAEASEKLTDLFKFNIPQRWSISHLYQAILNGEEHVSQIACITTLAGYIHYLLTGKHELGVGDASGMFPVAGNNYDSEMLDKFKNLIKDKNYSWNIAEILPQIKTAGEKGSVLTDEGAKFLDPTGNLTPGIAVCPPEGDAGTGMVATNSVAPKTGNISAGTSVFAMLVLENPLKNYYPEIDIAATPDGKTVAMVHCNNCCGELDAWVNIFDEFASLAGLNADKGRIYELLYKNALNADLKGVTAYNYLSGEHITGIEKGRPMYFRTPDGTMNLGGFIKSQLFSAFATLSLGMEILFEKEQVCTENILAHGGLFKVKGVAQQILSNAINTPVSVMSTAGEGGAWGMALLAAYMQNSNGKTLGDWLDSAVFKSMDSSSLSPEANGVAQFKEFIKNYKAGLDAVKKLEGVN